MTLFSVKRNEFGGKISSVAGQPRVLVAATSRRKPAPSRQNAPCAGEKRMRHGSARYPSQTTIEYIPLPQRRGTYRRRAGTD